jgi:hypothetical protein
MHILLTRDTWTPTSTTGTLSIDGKPFGFSLEDVDRSLNQSDDPSRIQRLKVPGATAIPYGTYTVRKTWSPKYGRHMPEVCDVPGFRGIRIHAGNDDGDTAGCILPGKSRARNRVYTSAKYAAWLEKEILAALDAGEAVTLTITRS